MRARQFHGLGLGMPPAHHAQLHGRTRLALQQHRRVGERHIARADPLNALDHVAGRESGLRGRRIRNRAHNTHKSELFGEDQARARALHILGPEILLVLVRVQIAGERINSFQEAIESAQSHGLHVRLFHVFALDVSHHIAKYADVLEGAIRRGRLTQNAADQKQKRQAR
jgi:hypothetical protein